jgi:hypothetical protein
MRIIVHTGWRKTGTSAIQRLLHANQDLLRERYSINYPEAGLAGHAHHVAGWKLLGRLPPPWQKIDETSPRWRQARFADMIEETAKRGCTTLLVSSETLSGLAEPRALAQALGERTAEIVAYVRRQDRYIEARYNQQVKDGRAKAGLAQFAEASLAGLDYHDHFQRWVAVFGRANVKVRVYERSAFRQGDVRLDFLDAIGIEERGLAFSEGLANESLGYSAVQFMRRFNPNLRNGAERRRVARLLERWTAAHPDHKSLLAPEQRCAIMERVRESNARLAREFLGLEDVFRIGAAELAAEAGLDRHFDEKSYLRMEGYVLPRLQSWRRRAGEADRGETERA